MVKGTSAGAWSDWKESLVWQLFHTTTQYLVDQKSYYEQTKIERESLQAAVLENLTADYRDEIEAHFDFMPDNYFRATEVSEVVKHLRLFRTFLENVCALDGRPLAPAVNWEPLPEQGHTIVSFIIGTGSSYSRKSPVHSRAWASTSCPSIPLPAVITPF